MLRNPTARRARGSTRRCETVAVGSGQLRNALFPLAKLLRERRPDVVLSSVLDANIVAAAARALAGTPRSRLVVRETNSQRARDDIGAVRRRLARRAYRSADAVVALSEGVRQELIEDFALRTDRVVTIHNPVEFDTLAEEARTAPPPPVKKEGLWIMGVGRLIAPEGLRPADPRRRSPAAAGCAARAGRRRAGPRNAAIAGATNSASVIA